MDDVLTRRRRYPIYIVLDASESMRLDLETGRLHRGHELANTPLGSFARLITRTIIALSEDPAVNNLASVSVLSFDDTSHVLRPMSSLATPASILLPPTGWETDYRKILSTLVRSYHDDVLLLQHDHRDEEAQIVVAPPWIFFITDGAPYADRRPQARADWLPYRSTLVSSPINARIATFGLPGSYEPVLWALATGDGDAARDAFVAENPSDLVGLADITATMIERSVSRSVPKGKLLIDLPAGMRRVERTRHV